VLEPVEDSWIDELAPTTNSGGDPTLDVGVVTSAGKGESEPRKWRSFLAFDLGGALPPGATLLGAWLYGYPTYVRTPDALAIFRNETPFNESTLTWESQAAAATMPSLEVWYSPPTSGVWTAQEATALVDDCIANRGGRCSWQLRWINAVDNTIVGLVDFKGKDERSV
jgi:hypothetical protein